MLDKILLRGIEVKSRVKTMADVSNSFFNILSHDSYWVCDRPIRNGICWSNDRIISLSNSQLFEMIVDSNPRDERVGSK